MTSTLTTTSRQKRELEIPEPGRKGNIKVTLDGWVACARVVLIEEGIGSVKVDRLAKRLSVTRGGFYYHFKNHHHLLEVLLENWRVENCFTPREIDVSTTMAAFNSFQEMSDNLVHERGFDPQYDMAIREWARVSKPVSAIVQEVDAKRTDILRQIFAGMGYNEHEADVRANLLYTHQIGYYIVGVEDDTATRESKLNTYLSILGGEAYTKAAAEKAASS